MATDARRIVAVTGAGGWVGGAVCDWLSSRGVAVRALRRRPARPGEPALNLEIGTEKEWATILDGCGAVVHCAAHVHRPNETDRERVLFSRVNVEGTARLLRACELAGVERFVFAGSSAIYDWLHAQGRVAETGPIAPPTAYAASKWAGEELVRASTLDWTIVRLGTVFGAGDTANFSRLAAALRRRRFLLPGRGTARKSVLSLRLAGEVLGRFAVGPQGRGGQFNVALPVAPTLVEICDVLCTHCGFPPPPRVPLGILRGIAAAGSVARSLGLPSPLTTEVLAKLTTSTEMDVSQLNRLFPDLSHHDFFSEVGREAGYYAQC